MPNKIWGVDSAASVTSELYTCTVQNFGKPSYWGRYLTTVENVSDGLTKEEVNLLHENGVKILPIYNAYTRATGYRNGRVATANAIFHARRIGIPEGTFIFANTEKSFDIDEGWIRGWVDAMYPSGYRPGIYGSPDTDTFNQAYCTAVANDEQVSQQAVIWSEEPTPGVTKKNNAPTFNPLEPNCTSNVWAWQYGENADACPIDTNLMDSRLFQALW
ncbi:glycoside hydrolase domain-containing protein [Oceanobacillus halotolerans]|uniref:glycoside hydrolase domain-containing protein n=1 Tax=Oceanobacillus halotolerans TaxID=2663380 RepID=UPI001969C942|nr:glycoside hydrolase domain-containing protein [Oceanobacillus halotolerans]